MELEGGTVDRAELGCARGKKKRRIWAFSNRESDKSAETKEALKAEEFDLGGVAAAKKVRTGSILEKRGAVKWELPSWRKVYLYQATKRIHGQRGETEKHRNKGAQEDPETKNVKRKNIIEGRPGKENKERGWRQSVWDWETRRRGMRENLQKLVKKGSKEKKVFKTGGGCS